MKILLIEDDALIGQNIVKSLKLSHFLVDWFREGEAAFQALNHSEYSLLLLDINLPGINGFEILKNLRRKNTQLPVLIISARDRLDDRIGGLNDGADDYLVKPFHLDELLARINVLLRRQNFAHTNTLNYGSLTLDPVKHTVIYGGEKIDFSSKEFAILHALLENPDAVISRKKLEAKVYDWNDEIGSNSIQVFIHHIRKKLGEASIQNIRGVGYKIGKV
ncbi:response regulator transcription factor [Ferrovum sp. PN-J185]|uniref:response regulator n=1 Tax=Ferrovum sp. PN-J185 TaxID=1356306 RepID=UPI0007969696|nr:response regulator transcription factor [Ferrovum sp. PN-J185]KXW56392.1 transcriptional regulatory protein QseB [Ferrovum sp. PN-J185]MCC6069115.1 response regulator transcription factor [Ferrovum sp. PN-J185]MDE1890904.1 response regulator transcription factor [Betaproteobacteria bacterium]MDE2055784.1 response regulator transcription factor [Betaproteobacteria bacterium]